MTQAKANRLLLVLAHPALERSRAGSALAAAASGMAGVTLFDLYETYPDFQIDIAAEQQRLVDHAVVALQFPFYWYSTPALLKEWIDVVWRHGFAYGQGGDALKGKRLFVACSTGGREEAYCGEGYNRYTMAEFLRPLEQTAHLCGMVWTTPFVVHGSPVKERGALELEAERYRARLEVLAAEAQA